MKVTYRLIKIFPPEAMIWIVALVLLFLFDESREHISLCIFNFLGFDFCFGCGIGRSISSVLHGEILKSFSYHFFGLPATIILVSRIIQLFLHQQKIKKHERNFYASTTYNIA